MLSICPGKFEHILLSEWRCESVGALLYGNITWPNALCFRNAKKAPTSATPQQRNRNQKDFQYSRMLLFFENRLGPSGGSGVWFGGVGIARGGCLIFFLLPEESLIWQREKVQMH
ncbi:hypothetical protein LSM04_009626 [Trypanosoma melophagium]|nr:hypothetical protein LSM04_009626 [Trypanosoma melophagium]